MGGGEILEMLLKHLNINAKELSEKCGYDRPQAFYDVQKGKTQKISTVMADKIISVFPQINSVWLRTGEGQMIKGDNDKEAALNKRQVDMVPLLPLNAVGGSLVGFAEDSVRLQDCDTVTAPIQGVDFALSVYGDSMYPNYPNGCRVFVKRIDPASYIPWGSVFVLDTTNGIILKQVVESKREGYVRCHSLNENGLYADFDVPMKDIRGMFKVLASLNAQW